MLLQEAITTNPHRFDNLNFDRLTDTYHLAQGIIEQLTPEATLELFSSADEAGMHLLMDAIVDEAYQVLYGGNQKQIKSQQFGYLDKLNTSIDETLRCENIGYFITNVMPEFEMNWHHLDWCEIIQSHKYACVLAARDHGKSFMFSNAYPCWQLYRYKPVTAKQKLNNRGLLISFSMQQAVDLMSIIKDSVEGNDILRERIYNKDKWSATDIKAKTGSRLTVKGFGSSVRGIHPYWIMVDDGLKDNVIYSQDQRTKNINYFHSVLMNAIIPGGKVNVVGTPFHNQDLYGDLKTKPNWKVFEYPSVFPDGRILWENRYTFADLMEKRKGQGNLIFSRELLCRPITSDSTIFPMEILNNSILRMDKYTLVNNRESFPVKFDRVVVGCDFAISGSVGADYSVYTVWGIDDKDTMWLLYALREKGLSFAQQITHLKLINQNFRPDVMVLENNNFQQIFVSEADKAGLPVVPHTTTGKKHDLKEGWASLALLFERGCIKLPYGDQKSKDFADMAMLEFSSVAYTDDKGLVSTDGHDDICSSFWLSSIAVKRIVVDAFNFGFI